MAMSAPLAILYSILVLVASSWLYIRANDKKLKAQPSDVFKAFSPKRYAPEDFERTEKEDHERLIEISAQEQLPPKTGRHYIVVGGAGFLGGWIVVHLLQRGEDPKKIRVFDLRAPQRHDLTTGSAKDVDFILGDVSDAKSVHAAFSKPWPGLPADALPEVTVFHTAANIRFYERHVGLLQNSLVVNVNGTQNVIKSAKAIGATALVYTSSGSVAVRRTRFWLWPWEASPKHFVQVINDDDNIIPKRHEDFFSNYAVTKILAEREVRAANGAFSAGQRILRTGCIRPGNGIFGPGGDMLCGAYLVRKANPAWIHNILQSFIYVENCSLAHLCYEQRLLELSSPDCSNPDISGQAFNVTDPGPPPTYGDVYVGLETLSAGEVNFPALSPTAMLLLAQFIELYYLARHVFGMKWLPAVNGDLVNLQPSLWALTQVHLIFDDSRARLPPEKGGLGYRGRWTTMEALYKLVVEHKAGVSKFDTRADLGGISLGFGSKVQKGAKKVNDQVGGALTMDPLHVPN
ncbi:hypothetical protein HGRIS_000291 [Hohenbuehelia grisea]|uniref:3-beta hydroxysteroid dehydrogenase/isomerase domain-containing protein n=1 Tax=Hohenbuehelia grisea TaxID=104357 RepID=A0ABR3JQS3_9AGAR